MILVDTSAWVEFLRATGSAVDHTLTRLLADQAPLASTDVVIMELLAGARDRRDADRLRGLLARTEHLAVRAPTDFEQAAELYRGCRAAGLTVRKLTDCLIAVVALRHEAALLHNDADFDAIAACSALQTHPTAR